MWVANRVTRYSMRESMGVDHVRSEWHVTGTDVTWGFRGGSRTTCRGKSRGDGWDRYTPAVIDTAVFAGMSSTGPVQVRDGTPRLSFVPVGGAFIDADTAASLQSQPATYLAAVQDGEDNAPSPLTLSPVPPHSEKSSSPVP